MLRPGRTVSLRQAELVDDAGRVLARAQAWTFPDGQGPGETGDPLPHRPADGHLEEPPASWARGYLDAMEWLWIEGAVTRPGPATVWMRPRLPLVPGETMSPLQRLLCCVDSASGASAALDPDAVELHEHRAHRAPACARSVGDWVCLDAATTIGTGSVGVAASEVYDEQGLVARSAQALLVTARPTQPAG